MKKRDRREYNRLWRAKNREADLATHKRYRVQHRERINARERLRRKTERFSKYGLTVEKFNAALMTQGGGCAICGTSIAGRGKTRLVVDHNHKTGRVRGLLCHRCNFAEGLLKTPALARALADYMEADDDQA